MTAYLTVQEVAARWGVTDRTVRNWIYAGRLPAVRAGAGRPWRIPAGAASTTSRSDPASPMRELARLLRQEVQEADRQQQALVAQTIRMVSLAVAAVASGTPPAQALAAARTGSIPRKEKPDAPSPFSFA